jgi:hypothetical protein
MYEKMNPQSEMGIFQIGSRLIPHKTITGSTDEFVATLRAVNERAGAWVSGLAFNASKVPVVPNAVNPAWRTSSVSLVIGT